MGRFLIFKRLALAVGRSYWPTLKIRLVSYPDNFFVVGKRDGSKEIRDVSVSSGLAAIAAFSVEIAALQIL